MAISFQHIHTDVLRTCLFPCLFNDQNFSSLGAIARVCKAWKKVADEAFDPTLFNYAPILKVCKAGDHVLLTSWLIKLQGKEADNALVGTLQLGLLFATEINALAIVTLLTKLPTLNPFASVSSLINKAQELNHLKAIEELKEIFPNNDTNPLAHPVIALAACNGHLEMVKALLLDPRVDPADGNNGVIRLASQNGHVETVKALLQHPRVDPAADDNYAIQSASENGHVETVKALLLDPRVDPAADDNYAIRSASQNGHVETVKALLQHPRVDPAARHNNAIQWASQNGHVETVKALLLDPRVDPAARHNNAIQWASQNGHIETVKALLLSPRIDPIACNRLITNPLVRAAINEDQTIQALFNQNCLQIFFKRLLAKVRSCWKKFLVICARLNRHIKLTVKKIKVRSNPL